MGRSSDGSPVNGLVVRLIIVTLALLAIGCSGRATAERTDPPTPAATDPPWSSDWRVGVCLAHKNAGDALSHLQAAGDALGAYDVDVANTELTAAAKDATEVGEEVSVVTPWPAGDAMLAAVTKAGVELRKTAGITKLAIEGEATDTEVGAQVDVAVAASADMEVALRKLTAATGFACAY